MGSVNGRFFAWELKRSEAEARKKTGRIVLQKHILEKIHKSGGVAEVVHPGNLDMCYQHLKRISTLPNTNHPSNIS